MPTIQELREGQGLTRKQLAALLGVSHMAIFFWESGRRMPLASNLRDIARQFGVSMDDIALPGDALAPSRVVE